jgi:hypothetical protein
VHRKGDGKIKKEIKFSLVHSAEPRASWKEHQYSLAYLYKSYRNKSATPNDVR